MRASLGKAFVAGISLLALYAAVFVLLSVDAQVRIWGARSGFGSGWALLLAFEVVHAVTVLGAGALAVALVKRDRGAGDRALAVCLLFLAVWYAKAAGYGGYAGFVQERLARALLARGVSRALLAFLFGTPSWSLWLATAAFLRFSVLFPRPLRPGEIAVTGAGDRTGLLRSVPGAGMDVGAAMLRLAEAVATRGWAEPWPVWTAAWLLVGLYYVTGRHLAVGLFVGGLAAVATALGITNLRAGYRIADLEQKRVIDWLRRGAVAGAACFVLAAALQALSRSVVLAWLGFAILAAAPAAVLFCTAIAVLSTTDGWAATNRA